MSRATYTRSGFEFFFSISSAHSLQPFPRNACRPEQQWRGIDPPNMHRCGGSTLGAGDQQKPAIPRLLRYHRDASRGRSPTRTPRRLEGERRGRSPRAESVSPVPARSGTGLSPARRGEVVRDGCDDHPAEGEAMRWAVWNPVLRARTTAKSIGERSWVRSRRLVALRTSTHSGAQRQDKRPGDGGVERRQLGPVRFGKPNQVRVGRPRGRLAPSRKIVRRLVVSQESVARAQRREHVRQGLARFADGHASGGALDGHSHEAELRDRRGEQDGARPPPGCGKPFYRALMLDVIGPAPRDEDVDIEKVVHGKSASNSRTAWVVNGC
jgi:hypothetical protein